MKLFRTMKLSKTMKLSRTMGIPGSILRYRKVF